jgi:hypothetical protein
MKLNKLSNVSACAFLLVLTCYCSTLVASAQTRDHLTDQEIELVRNAQILDKRIDVFIKAVDRRMLVLNGVDATGTKQVQKDSDTWGGLPKGTRAELLGDVAKILDEAITNIEDVSAHDERSPLIPKALRKLSAASTGLMDQLTALRAQVKTEAERANLEESMENAQSIINAANKLPPSIEKEKKSSTKSQDNN